MRARRLLALVAGAAAVCSLMTSGSAAAKPESRSRLRLPARYDWTPPRSAVERARLTNRSLSATTVTEFSHTVTVAGTDYPYTMVGKDPFVVQSAPSTSIPTELIPIKIRFSALWGSPTWDPTVPDSGCDTSSALVRTRTSPVFKTQSFTWGGTTVGTAQYTDAFRRAEFWQYTNPSGLNPGYHLKLSLKSLPKMTVKVPNSAAFAFLPTSCGNGTLGEVDVNWFDHYVQTTLLPSLAGSGSVSSTTFPVFLLDNVVLFDGDPLFACCILGYHNAYTDGSGNQQTYGVAMYDNTGDFAGSGDVSALTHEVAEWADDPTTVNPTPSWGNIGQVSGCQTNLEVGDPLSGTVFPSLLSGFQYHLQELAFESWFYDVTPSRGVNGWYSNQGTFTTFAAPC
jgi:hypothetical protein